MPDLDAVFSKLRAIKPPYAAKLDAKKNDESELCLYTRMCTSSAWVLTLRES